eukprot:gnl/MRDRNA2_/MRDRNA2_89570_c0_seq1.p1 gnl/MRDRNA2_/MRDRNA2_89570_c0~~gnl/MRDRNA2_/MRDRNA2_89570_c0_seq1.p1  ORF type:complete len:192 (+),score=65.35 gnl/MRDRNA2_/MRDRNA2_89570_c0_seq1:76-651(+)
MDPMAMMKGMGKGGMNPMMMMMMMKGKAMGKGFDKGKGDFKGKGVGKGEFGIKQVLDAFKHSGVCPGGSKWENDEKTVFITGLPADTTDLDVYKLFAPFGAIALNGAVALRDKEDKEKCRGIAVVNFLEQEAADNCIACHNGAVMPDGQTVLKVQAHNAERAAASSAKRKMEEADGPQAPGPAKKKGKGKK